MQVFFQRDQKRNDNVDCHLGSWYMKLTVFWSRLQCYVLGLCCLKVSVLSLCSVLYSYMWSLWFFCSWFLKLTMFFSWSVKLKFFCFLVCETENVLFLSMQHTVFCLFIYFYPKRRKEWWIYILLCQTYDENNKLTCLLYVHHIFPVHVLLSCIYLYFSNYKLKVPSCSDAHWRPFSSSATTWK